MLKPTEFINNFEFQNSDDFCLECEMKLNQNENYIGISTDALMAIKNLEAKDVCAYPSYSSLYKTIVDFHKIDISSVALTSGFDEAISSLLFSYLNKGDSIVIATPYDSNISKIVCKVGVNLIEVPYKNKWIYPIDEIMDVLETANALIISTPNNPTGDVLSESQIAHILESYPDKLIIIDESYSNFSGFTNLPLLQKYDNVAIYKSCSKDYGLAGLRFGYILADRTIIDSVKKVLPQYNVSVVASVAAEASLKDQNFVKYVANEIARSRQYLTDEIRKMGFDVYRSYGNFILVNFGDKADLVYQKFKSNNIIVKNYSNETALLGHLRVTVPTLSASERIISLLKSRNTIVFNFDLFFDVTLSVFKAIQLTYNHFTGKNISEADIIRMRALAGTSSYTKLLLEIISRSGFNYPREDILKVYSNYYWVDGSALIDDEKLIVDCDMLCNLAQKYNVAVYTDRTTQETKFLLKKFNLTKYFQKIITSDDIPESLRMPDTTPLLMIKESLITDYLICFFDSTDAILASNKYNYSVPIGFVPFFDKSNLHKETIEKLGISKFISNFDELVDFLEHSL